MKKVKIGIKPSGWTVIQEANAEKHILEISCLAEDGKIIEIRKRHNDGEEQKITSKIDATHSLPMDIDEFKTAVENQEILLK